MKTDINVGTNKDMEIEKTDTDVPTNMVMAIPLVKVWKVFNLVI